MVRKSKKSVRSGVRHLTRKGGKVSPIQHHHLLIRCETAVHPKKNDKERIRALLDNVVRDIGMKKLGGQTFAVDGSRSTEGITGVNVIETSHIAAHFWNYPEKGILHHPRSRSLLQFDIYTCGNLTNGDIIAALELLEEYEPTHVDITLLNRKWSLSISRHMVWDLGDGSENWREWIDKQRLMS
jgi:S-adenosylmethionine/arginine decarboxylase-like enzyme